jgi:hypothetical protein
MEIDLERIARAIGQFGSAVDEIRRAVRVGRAGVVRVHTEDRQIELPAGWAAAGLAVLAIAAVLNSVPARRQREEEPLGIG